MQFKNSFAKCKPLQHLVEKRQNQSRGIAILIFTNILSIGSTPLCHPENPLSKQESRTKIDGKDAYNTYASFGIV